MYFLGIETQITGVVNNIIVENILDGWDGVVGIENFLDLLILRVIMKLLRQSLNPKVLNKIYTVYMYRYGHQLKLSWALKQDYNKKIIVYVYTKYAI